MTALPRTRADDAGFAELTIVRLCSLVSLEEGQIQPGTVGTIVYRHDGSDAYEVEFDQPFPAVVTLRGSDLDLAA